MTMTTPDRRPDDAAVTTRALTKTARQAKIVDLLSASAANEPNRDDPPPSSR